MSSIQNKVQNVLRFADEHHQRIFRVSYIALILPVLILTIVPLLSPLFLQLPNADVVEFQLRRSLATIDIGYYSLCLGHSDRSFTGPNNYTYLQGCIGTVDSHATGKTLAQQWGKAAAAGPEVYERLVDDFSMALNLQRNAFYPGPIIAAAVLWILSLGLFAAAPLVGRNKKIWVLRASQGSAVVASVLIVMASVATTASVYAVVQYVHPGYYSGRLGAILAVQWAAAGAMSVHSLLAFFAGGEDKSEGSIRLEN